jgi:hypothetical protein
VVSRASASALHRWLARLGPSDVPPAAALGRLASDALRGAGTLLAIADGAAFDQVAADTLGGLSRSVSRIVLVTVAGDAPRRLPGGIDVVPWLGVEGFGAAVRAATPETAGASS